jgi:membrane protein YdbS with pleckstrin-like domain
MTVDQKKRGRQHDAQRPPAADGPLLTARALLLLLCAVGCGVLAVLVPALAIGIAVAVAVLTLLHVVVGE